MTDAQGSELISAVYQVANELAAMGRIEAQTMRLVNVCFFLLLVNLFFLIYLLRRR